MSAAESTTVALSAPRSLSATNSRRLVRYSEVIKQPLEWLWPQRIAIGKLTLLVGEPGLGKGLLTVDLAARVSRGRPWPDQPDAHAPLGTAVILHAEDDQCDTMPERLEAAGADLEKIVTLDTNASDDVCQLGQPFSLRHEIGALQAALAGTPDCKLVVIDPITAYLGGADGNQNGEIRALMYGLAELARVHRVAIVAVAHLNKRESAGSVHRVMGALSFVSTARTVLSIVRDPTDPQRRLIHAMKNNLAGEIHVAGFQLAHVEGKLAPRVEWNTGPILLSPQSTLVPSRFNLKERKYYDHEDHTTVRLREELSDGPKPRLYLTTHVPGSEDQLYRAADRLGVVKVKDGFFDGWSWMLPEHVAHYEELQKHRKELQQREWQKRRNARARKAREAKRKAKEAAAQGGKAIKR